MIVGVDLDGVLGNQIAGVLPRIVAELGIELRYEDVTHWRLPLGDTNIADQIVGAMSEPNYIRSMPVHAGAVEMMKALSARYRVVVITARPQSTQVATEEWLRRNDLAFDELAIADEAKKSLHATDALIDDYTGNLVEYLTNTSGTAILVDQPWNQDRAVLTRWFGTQRLHEVAKLTDVPPLVDAVAPRDH